MPLPKTHTLSVFAVAAAITFASAAGAQAHVHVIPESTAAGRETKLTFRVPDESETATTTKVAVSLPVDTPLAEVSAQPLAGWTVSITEGDLPKPVTVEGTTLTKAPTTVTWTASGTDQVAGIGPGEFQEFALSGGPIPADAAQLGFPVAQTYSDGTIVQWNQPQAPGADEPEHPLPAFAVTAAATTSSSDSDGNGVAVGLGAAGLVAGLIGAGLGATALLRSRRS